MTRKHAPRRRLALVPFGRAADGTTASILTRVLVDPRQVLVPGTRRAVPFHPLSMAAVEYRRAGSTDTPAVVLNARRRARKARR